MKRFVDGVEHEFRDDVKIIDAGDRLMVRTAAGAFSALAVEVPGAVLVSFKGQQYRVEKKLPRRAKHAAAASGTICAPMPGLIVDVRVQDGQSVVKGQVLVVLEAMKTQQPLVAPFDGIVAKIHVKPRQQVAESESALVC